ncbi:MAG: hypothetical protein C5B48_12375 [Candidatus Rokuibacteriota bacterium]|nr:MAG: hypothetical protein C5B48_12375 [Candidatus Rokubacteria bacterium]
MIIPDRLVKAASGREDTMERTKWMRGTLLAAGLTMVVALLLFQSNAFRVTAADHRDAPAVDERPEADINDVYAFTDPNDSSKVVLALDVNGFAAPSVTNTYSFGQDVVYQIKIDNDGDGKEDLVIQARFSGTESVRDPRCAAPSPGGQFITIHGPSAPASTGATNTELSDVEIQGCTGAILGPSPRGIRVFAGLREDPFVTDIAQFNRILGNRQDVFRAFTSPALGPLRGRALRADGTSGVDGFFGFNTSVLVFQVPKSLIQGAASRAGTYLQNGTTIGVWGTTNVQSSTAPTEFVQFDRMGQQLFNTVFMPAAMKDAFNAAIPENDRSAFSSFVPDALTTTDNDGTGNTIAGRVVVLNAVGSATPPNGAPLLLPDTFPNADTDLLRKALLPDVLRLDLSKAATDLGIGGNGLQNGRRLGDDVLDIALRLLRQLADVQFPAGSGLPGSGAATRPGALNCTALPACQDRRVLAVLQGSDFNRPDSTLADLSTSGNDKHILFDFPYFASAQPFPGDPGSTDFDVQNLGLAAAILPSSRSVATGTPATAFATVINPSTQTAIGVSIAPATPVPGTFTYQTTNPSNQLTGSPNTPVNVAGGASQNFVLSFTSTSVIIPSIVEFNIGGTNTTPAPSINGVNTLLLSVSPSATADIVALIATPTNNGIVNVPLNQTAPFSIAVTNAGATDTITASLDTGTAVLPLALAICQTNSSGACQGTATGSVTTSIGAGATATFGAFVTAGQTAVPLNPAASRIFVRFKDPSGATRGLTSVAVQTQ